MKIWASQSICQMASRERFRIVVHPTRRYFADAMGEDSTEMKKMQTLKTEAKFCVFSSFLPWKNKNLKTHCGGYSPPA